MSGETPQFDRLAASYEDLLRDPLRDRFTGGSSAFFHVRKRDLICDYFRRRLTDTAALSFLDLGCGKGELLALLQSRFNHVAGCDPSAGMLAAGACRELGIETRVQPSPQSIPFSDSEFDFISAVCVYHHVPPSQRAELTAEVRRVLKPGGVFALIEHNPYNPITRLIVSRTPVDADAVLLPPPETRALLRPPAFHIDDQKFFLYFPEGIYCRFKGLESALGRVPLGGQYAVFARSLPA